jgi:deoxycytidine triphosphate deaminase
MQAYNGYYQFEAGKQYALDFMEDVTVPDNMAAFIVHRSTINRTIGTITTGVYDPGFRSDAGCGAIFRPLSNVQIQVGYRMAQIIFYTASAASQYDGQYQAR